MRKLATIIALFLTLPAHAHIGSPDTFVQAQAGPYKFLLAAHPPTVYPGALELDLRFDPSDHIATASASLDSGTPTPIRIFDAGTATASLWLATPAAHTIHITVQGNVYDLSLPAGASTPPASSINRSTLRRMTGFMQLPVVLIMVFVLYRRYHDQPLRRWQIVPILAAYGVFLALSAAAFFVPPGPPPRTTLTADLSNSTLDLTLTNPSENFADIVPDHGKLLHLFLVRQPRQDVFLHLHPQQLSPGHFSMPLPAMPPGTYRLFADFYLAPAGNLANARGETASLTLDLPAQFHSSSNDPDDTIAILSADSATSVENPASSTTTYTDHLRDGYTLQLTAPTSLQPLRANLFQVSLLDPSGHPPADMALYLGMPAHAVILSQDNNVFAHIHPGGTLPMLAKQSMPAMPDMPGMSMPSASGPTSNTATIPYGFPRSGSYQFFVQMKHGTTVETASFPLKVRSLQ